MKYFTNEDQNNYYFSKRYKNFYYLLRSLTKELVILLPKIQTSRGGIWYKEESITLEKEITLIFVRGYQPVYSKELDGLISDFFE